MKTSEYNVENESHRTKLYSFVAQGHIQLHLDRTRLSKSRHARRVFGRCK